MSAMPEPSGSALHYLEYELRDLLTRSSDAWDFLQQGSLDGVWYWDLEDPDTEWMSPEFWHPFGVDPATKDHSPAAWQDIIFQEDLYVALENFHRHCEDPTHPYDQIVRYRHADGSTVWVRCRGIAIRDDTGRPIRMLGAHNDLTAIKRAEEEAQREKAKLKLANEELIAFTYGVSHDLKSPSRTALQMVQEGLLADEGNLTADQREMFEGAVNTLERMQLLISDLLDYGILVDQRKPEETVILRDVVKEVLGDLKSEMSDTAARIDIGVLSNISGYRSQIRVLVQNLIINAIKYRRAGVAPVIKISQGPEANGMIPIMFEDNACGIAHEHFDKIFGVFTRLHRHDEVPGSGLGLAICKRVAFNHDGKIDVTSTPGSGSTFTLYVPNGRRKS